jgi:hypothetical protein
MNANDTIGHALRVGGRAAGNGLTPGVEHDGEPVDLDCEGMAVLLRLHVRRRRVVRALLAAQSGDGRRRSARIDGWADWRRCRQPPYAELERCRTSGTMSPGICLLR